MHLSSLEIVRSNAAKSAAIHWERTQNRKGITGSLAGYRHAVRNPVDRAHPTRPIAGEKPAFLRLSRDGSFPVRFNSRRIGKSDSNQRAAEAQKYAVSSRSTPRQVPIESDLLLRDQFISVRFIVRSRKGGSERITAIAVIDQFAVTAELSTMSDAHSRIIASAAKAELGPIGFRQRGRSRLWLVDHGYWLNVVEFTPNRRSKSVSLMNAAHWLWAGAGFMSFNEAVPSSCHAEFETEEQFRDAANKIAKVARAEALKIESRFGSFQAIADFVIERARTSPDRMGPSWWGYEAGIASELIGRFDDAHGFLHSLTDERVTKHADPLLPIIDRPDAFRREVNGLVMQQRAALKLDVLESPPF